MHFGRFVVVTAGLALATAASALSPVAGTAVVLAGGMALAGRTFGNTLVKDSVKIELPLELAIKEMRERRQAPSLPANVIETPGRGCNGNSPFYLIKTSVAVDLNNGDGPVRNYIYKPNIPGPTCGNADWTNEADFTYTGGLNDLCPNEATLKAGIHAYCNPPTTSPPPTSPTTPPPLTTPPPPSLPANVTIGRGCHVPFDGTPIAVISTVRPYRRVSPNVNDPVLREHISVLSGGGCTPTSGRQWNAQFFYDAIGEDPPYDEVCNKVTSLRSDLIAYCNSQPTPPPFNTSAIMETPGQGCNGNSTYLIKATEVIQGGIAAGNNAALLKMTDRCDVVPPNFVADFTYVGSDTGCYVLPSLRSSIATYCANQQATASTTPTTAIPTREAPPSDEPYTDPTDGTEYFDAYSTPQTDEGLKPSPVEDDDSASIGIGVGMGVGILGAGGAVAALAGALVYQKHKKKEVELPPVAKPIYEDIVVVPKIYDDVVVVMSEIKQTETV